MDDAADHPPVIDPGHAPRLVRQQGRQPLPLRIGQPNPVRRDPTPTV